MLDHNDIELFPYYVKKLLENAVAPPYHPWEKSELFPRDPLYKLA